MFYAYVEGRGNTSSGVFPPQTLKHTTRRGGVVGPKNGARGANFPCDVNTRKIGGGAKMARLGRENVIGGQLQGGQHLGRRKVRGANFAWRPRAVSPDPPSAADGSGQRGVPFPAPNPLPSPLLPINPSPPDQPSPSDQNPSLTPPKKRAILVSVGQDGTSGAWKGDGGPRDLPADVRGGEGGGRVRHRGSWPPFLHFFRP